MPAVLAWRGEPADSQLALAAMQVSAWEGITLPRQWDNPERGYEEEPDEQLADLLGRVTQALQVWADSLCHLQRT